MAIKSWKLTAGKEIGDRHRKCVGPDKRDRLQVAGGIVRKVGEQIFVASDWCLPARACLRRARWPTGLELRRCRLAPADSPRQSTVRSWWQVDRRWCARRCRHSPGAADKKANPPVRIELRAGAIAGLKSSRSKRHASEQGIASCHHEAHGGGLLAGLVAANEKDAAA
jgi:hypothetical protein